ncbi:hypothetical protein [Trichloromonas sp.]|uniref:carboxypeptidase-like regulatory domain-containing protein n=1 Tax=Trichloromonas sp. TaxID=3069249 RepID=UPI003D815581
MTGKKPLQALLTGLLIATLGACAPADPPALSAAPAANLTGISGLVTDDHNQPTSGAYVYAYRNRRSNLRGPADFEARTDSRGSYFLDVIDGDYYLVARMRREGGDAGPPRPGDAWAIPAVNPTRVVKDRTSRVDFQLQTMMQSMIMREGTLTSGSTGFTGRILDDRGQPAAGAFVLAYRDGDFHRMPDYTSLPVDGEGRFTLYLPEAGSYCLAARTRTRGQPVAGEPYGVLESASGGCPSLESGQILDIGAIVLKPYRR